MRPTNPTRTTTIQTRLPRDTELSAIASLDAYAELYSRLERIAIATIVAGKKLDKNAFLKDHGITGRQYNAITRNAQGKVDSQLSNLEYYISDCTAKIKGVERRIAKKLKTLELHKKSGKTKSTPEVIKLIQDIRKHRERVQRIQARRTEFEERLTAKSPRICMGSSKLFHAQHNLAENGFADHAEWLHAWRRERSSQLFVLGSKDENGGCQGCVILPQADGLYTLQLRLPDALKEAHGQYCYLTDIAFSHDKHWLDQAIHANQVRKTALANYRQQAKDPEFIGPLDKESRFLESYGQALSYRFVRDEKRGWRVLVTTERSGKHISTSTKKGSIGIDLNNHHLAVTEVDQKGNKVNCFDLVFRHQEDITSRQTATALEMAAVQLVALAKQTGKSLIVECLNFKTKKQSLKKGIASDAKINKIVSALVYKKFRAILETRSFKEGVEVIAVNPAYTSFIGKLKYLNQTNNSVHQAAGLVIARRGMGLPDPLPKTSTLPVFGRPYTFRAPVDARNDDDKCLKKAKTAYDMWYTETRGAIRRRRNMCRVRIASCLEQIPF